MLFGAGLWLLTYSLTQAQYFIIIPKQGSRVIIITQNLLSTDQSCKAVKDVLRRYTWTYISDFCVPFIVFV
jgi:hypothetical protein